MAVVAWPGGRWCVESALLTMLGNIALSML